MGGTELFVAGARTSVGSKIVPYLSLSVGVPSDHFDQVCHRFMHSVNATSPKWLNIYALERPVEKSERLECAA